MKEEAAPSHSFELVALPLMDHVFSTALYLTRDRDEAEDLVQETYLRAHRFWNRFEPGTNCRAWLMTIAHNLFRNRYREKLKNARDVELDENVLERPPASDAESDDPERLVMAQVLDEEVERAMKALPGDYLEAVLLVDLQELSYEEAAAAMDCPVGTVRSRLSRGRRLLHEALLEYARERGLVRGG
jgi:RNA polymerase sigma-70 factor (ECF subfamily)